jgi:hypothetical protein
VANISAIARPIPLLAPVTMATRSCNSPVITEVLCFGNSNWRGSHEHDIGLYLKRAMLLSSLFGNAAAQGRCYAEIAGLTIHPAARAEFAG